MESLTARMNTQHAELRADDKAQRDEIDRNHDAMMHALGELDRKFTQFASRQNAFFWALTGLGTFIARF